MELLNTIASYLEVLVVTVSVYFIWKQLKDNSGYLKSANVQSLVELTTPFNIELLRDRELTKLWISGSNNYPDLDEVDKWRFELMVIHWLNIHENAFIQCKNQLLDSQSYKPWEQDLTKFILKTCPESVWINHKEIYHPEFVSKINSLFVKKSHERHVDTT